MRGAFSLPTFILAMAFIGFASLARENDLSLSQTALMTGLVWALPSIVVLTESLASNASLFTTAIAVALASVRLLPMTVALMPIMREKGKTKTWHALLLSHFVAVTAWVYAMTHLPDMPRHGRAAFFGGFAVTVSSTVFLVTIVAYWSFPQIPFMLAGGLVLLTPIYFLMSMWSASRLGSDKLAMLMGLVLGPAFHLYSETLGLLLTGLIGGTAAYGIFYWRSKRETK